MNTKRLYGADGYAVKEMLKVTSLLYGATKSDVAEELESTENSSEISFDVSSRVGFSCVAIFLHTYMLLLYFFLLFFLFCKRNDCIDDIG
jgi:hypothetical protein